MRLTTAIRFLVLLAGLAANTALASATLPAGWSVSSASKEFEASLDRQVSRSGKASASIRNIVTQPEGTGTLMQTFAAGIYCGKRVRLTGYLKTVNATSAQLWMKVDGHDQTIAVDNMANRPVTGTVDWVKCELVLEVPADAINVSFGCLLRGTGQLWCDDLRFEVVGKGVPVTDSSGDPAKAVKAGDKQEAVKRDPIIHPAKNTQPRNLGFEENG